MKLPFHSLCNPTIFRIGIVAAPKFLKLAVVLLVDALMARYMGVAAFGLYSLVYAIFTTLAVFSRFGLENVLVRDHVNGALGPGRLAQALTVRLCGGLLAQAIFVGMALAVPTLQPYVVQLAVLSTGLLAVAIGMFEPLMQAHQKFGLMAVAQSAVILAGAVVKLVLIQLGAEPALFWYAILAEYLMAALLTVAFLVSEGSLPQFSVTRNSLRRYIREGAPFMVASLSVIAFMRIDQIMLSGISGVESVGLYSAALRITESFFALATIASVVLFPKLLQLRTKSRAAYDEAFVGQLRGFLAIGLSLSVVITVFAKPIVSMVFGAAYAGSAQLIALHAWIMVPAFWGVLTHRWLVAERLGKYELLRTGVGLLLNVAFNLLLIPEYGAVGACVATLVAQLFAYVLINQIAGPLKELGALQLRAIRMSQMTTG